MFGFCRRPSAPLILHEWRRQIITDTVKDSRDGDYTADSATNDPAEQSADFSRSDHPMYDTVASFGDCTSANVSCLLAPSADESHFINRPFLGIQRSVSLSDIWREAQRHCSCCRGVVVRKSRPSGCFAHEEDIAMEKRMTKPGGFFSRCHCGSRSFDKNSWNCGCPGLWYKPDEGISREQNSDCECEDHKVPRNFRVSSQDPCTQGNHLNRLDDGARRRSRVPVDYFNRSRIVSQIHADAKLFARNANSQRLAQGKTTSESSNSSSCQSRTTGPVGDGKAQTSIVHVHSKLSAARAAQADSKPDDTARIGSPFRSWSLPNRQDISAKFGSWWRRGFRQTHPPDVGACSSSGWTLPRASSSDSENEARNAVRQSRRRARQQLHPGLAQVRQSKHHAAIHESSCLDGHRDVSHTRSSLVHGTHSTPVTTCSPPIASSSGKGGSLGGYGVYEAGRWPLPTPAPEARRKLADFPIDIHNPQGIVTAILRSGIQASESSSLSSLSTSSSEPMAVNRQGNNNEQASTQEAVVTQQLHGTAGSQPPSDGVGPKKSLSPPADATAALSEAVDEFRRVGKIYRDLTCRGNREAVRQLHQVREQANRQTVHNTGPSKEASGSHPVGVANAIGNSHRRPCSSQKFVGMGQVKHFPITCANQHLETAWDHGRPASYLSTPRAINSGSHGASIVEDASSAFADGNELDVAKQLMVPGWERLPTETEHCILAGQLPSAVLPFTCTLSSVVEGSEDNSEEREEVSENGARNGTLFSNETGYDVHAHGVTDTKNKACAQTSRLPIARPWANPRQWVRDLEARVDSRLREKNDWTFTNKLKPPGVGGDLDQATMLQVRCEDSRMSLRLGVAKLLAVTREIARRAATVFENSRR